MLFLDCRHHVILLLPLLVCVREWKSAAGSANTVCLVLSSHICQLTSRKRPICLCVCSFVYFLFLLELIVVFFWFVWGAHVICVPAFQNIFFYFRRMYFEVEYSNKIMNVCDFVLMALDAFTKHQQSGIHLPLSILRKCDTGVSIHGMFRFCVMHAVCCCGKSKSWAYVFTCFLSCSDAEYCRDCVP